MRILHTSTKKGIFPRDANCGAAVTSIEVTDVVIQEKWLEKMRKQHRRGISLLRILIAQTAISALFAVGVQAALLTNIEGVILVNHGDGFKPVAEAASLVAGDRIRADAGSADVQYENGCSMKVGPNQTVVVLFTPPACGGGGLKDGVSAGEGPAFGLP